MTHPQNDTTPPPGLRLAVLPATYGICRMSAKTRIPKWIHDSTFYSISRSPDELSLICEQDVVPNGVKCEGGWRAFRVIGTLDMTLIGVLASLSLPLADARIGLITVSTFDTDYLLVRAKKLQKTIEVLTRAGHRFEDPNAGPSEEEPQEQNQVAAEQPSAPRATASVDEQITEDRSLEPEESDVSDSDSDKPEPRRRTRRRSRRRTRTVSTEAPSEAPPEVHAANGPEQPETPEPTTTEAAEEAGAEPEQEAVQPTPTETPRTVAPEPPSLPRANAGAAPLAYILARSSDLRFIAPSRGGACLGC